MRWRCGVQGMALRSAAYTPMMPVCDLKRCLPYTDSLHPMQAAKGTELLRLAKIDRQAVLGTQRQLLEQVRDWAVS